MSNQLNERIAADVMGIKFERVNYGWGYVFEGKQGTDLMPDFSGNCTSAWEVVEKLHKKGYYFSLAYERGAPRISVMFFKEALIKDKLLSPVTAIASTMAIAVCEAALKVIEKEKTYAL